jgi:hypothetical protein
MVAQDATNAGLRQDVRLEDLIERRVEMMDPRISTDTVDPHGPKGKGSSRPRASRRGSDVERGPLVDALDLGAMSVRL